MAKRFKMGFNRNYDVNKVVRRLTYTIIGLFIGGTIMYILYNVMYASCSQFYRGLQLVGWSIGANVTATDCPIDGGCTDCVIGLNTTSILSVVGLLAVAVIVLEFITFK